VQGEDHGIYWGIFIGGLWLFIPCNGNPMRIYNPVNVASWLVWWVDFATSFPKIILNLWNCWGGSVLCQVFFWCYVVSMFSLVFHIWKFEHFVLIINYLYIATCFWKNIFKNNIKTPSKKTEPNHFFTGVAHEQHWYSIICLFVVVLYCVQLLLLVVNIFKHPFTLSFAIAFLFYFLTSILWEFSKCLISPKYRMIPN